MNMQLDRFYNKLYPWAFEFVPKIIFAFLFLLIGLWFIRMISKWSHLAMHRRELDPSLKPFLLSLLVISLRILLVLGTMHIIGIQMTLFASVIAAFGVTAGLAVSGTLQNFASGILILILKPFLVGDKIISQGQEGTVSSIQRIKVRQMQEFCSLSQRGMEQRKIFS